AALEKSVAYSWYASAPRPFFESVMIFLSAATRASFRFSPPMSSLEADDDAGGGGTFAVGGRLESDTTSSGARSISASPTSICGDDVRFAFAVEMGAIGAGGRGGVRAAALVIAGAERGVGGDGNMAAGGTEMTLGGVAGGGIVDVFAPPEGGSS